MYLCLLIIKLNVDSTNKRHSFWCTKQKLSMEKQKWMSTSFYKVSVLSRFLFLSENSHFAAAHVMKNMGVWRDRLQSNIQLAADDSEPCAAV
jgi:hypothetical protein